MEYIQIDGGKPLDGELSVQKSKNAVLPMLAAVVLAEGTHVFQECPRITDVIHMTQILEKLGCSIHWEADCLVVDNPGLHQYDISSDEAGSMRSSCLFLGGLLGRYKKVILPYPGGCVIGKRPIDYHMQGLEQMGVVFREQEGKIEASAKQLEGCMIQLPFPSVGATENLMLAAVLAKGQTWIKGCAREPEIAAFGRMLHQMGAKIQWAAPDELIIQGVEKLHAAEYQIPGDRIVAGTYLIAAAATRGRAVLKDAPWEHLGALEIQLIKMGGRFRVLGDTVIFDGVNAVQGIEEVKTAPYPGFPTDLQSQLTAALTTAEEPSMIEETVFESRFAAALELRKLGAEIELKEHCIYINPVRSLQAGQVTAKDLRGGAALVIAGLMAPGITRIDGCHFLERGYVDIVEDIRSLNGCMKKLEEK